MTPEDREMLHQVAALSEENNALLRKTIRRSRIGTAFRFLYWLVIMAISVATYYYLQPYVQKLIPVVNTAITEINSAKNL